MVLSPEIDRLHYTEGQPSAAEEQEKIRLQQIQNLHHIFTETMHTRDMGAYAHGDEPMFSGDGATLYLLAELEGKTQVVLVGSGEFSVQTFTQNPPEGARYPKPRYADRFASVKTPLYVVRQRDSSHVDKGSPVHEMRQNNPAEFLAKYALMAARDKQVVINENAHPAHVRDTQSWSEKYNALENCQVASFNAEDTVPESYETLLARGRNAYIHNNQIAQEDFANFLASLPDSPEEIADFMFRIDRERQSRVGNEVRLKSYTTQELCLELVRTMATEREGILVYYSKAMRSILELKKDYDFEKKSF